MWRLAAKHHDGQGLEDGVPILQPAFAAAKKFRREEKFKEAVMVEAIATGGLWNSRRRFFL